MIVFKAHPKPVAAVVFTPDGAGLVTGSQAGTTVWTLSPTAVAARTFASADVSHPTGTAVSPCGRYLARSGKQFEVIDLAADTVIVSDAQLARSIAFSPDGSEVAMTQSDQPVRRWSVPAGRVLPGGWGGTRSSNGNRFPVGALAYSPDGKTLAQTFGVYNGVDGYDSHILLVALATGRQVGELKLPFQYDHPAQIVYSPDGSRIAGNCGPVVAVIAVSGGAVVAGIKDGTKHIKGLAFTPDGKHLVAVSNDERVRVYETGGWGEVRGYDWKVGKLGCVAVAPDGLRMAAGSATGKVVVWDVDG